MVVVDVVVSRVVDVGTDIGGEVTTRDAPTPPGNEGDDDDDDDDDSGGGGGGGRGSPDRALLDCDDGGGNAVVTLIDDVDAANDDSVGIDVTRAFSVVLWSCGTLVASTATVETTGFILPGPAPPHVSRSTTILRI